MADTAKERRGRKFTLRRKPKEADQFAGDSPDESKSAGRSPRTSPRSEKPPERVAVPGAAPPIQRRNSLSLAQSPVPFRRRASSSADSLPADLVVSAPFGVSVFLQDPSKTPEENAKLRREWEAEQKLQAALKKPPTKEFMPDPTKSADENAKAKREWEGEQKLQQALVNLQHNKEAAAKQAELLAKEREKKEREHHVNGFLERFTNKLSRTKHPKDAGAASSKEELVSLPSSTLLRPGQAAPAAPAKASRADDLAAEYVQQYGSLTPQNARKKRIQSEAEKTVNTEIKNDSYLSRFLEDKEETTPKAKPKGHQRFKSLDIRRTSAAADSAVISEDEEEEPSPVAERHRKEDSQKKPDRHRLSSSNKDISLNRSSSASTIARASRSKDSSRALRSSRDAIASPPQKSPPQEGSGEKSDESPPKTTGSRSSRAHGSSRKSSHTRKTPRKTTRVDAVKAASPTQRRRSRTVVPKKVLTIDSDEDNSSTFESDSEEAMPISTRKPKAESSSLPTIAPSAQKHVAAVVEQQEKPPAPIPMTLSKQRVTEDEVKGLLELGEELGRGAFSLVLKAKRVVDGLEVAVKVVDVVRLTPKQFAEIDAERVLLEQFHHPHVVNMLAIYETATRLYMVLELLPAGDLFNKILQKGCFSERACKRIVTQITEAVAAMHAMGIVHRDLKPENILCIEDPTTKQIDVKVADFGIAKKIGRGRAKSTCGSPGYVAPEVIRGEEYDLFVDMFSLGAIVYVLLAGYPPFWGDDMKTIIAKNLNVEFTFADMYWAHVSDAAKDFINHLILMNPAERMTAEQALAHPWLKPPAKKGK